YGFPSPAADGSPPMPFRLALRWLLLGSLLAVPASRVVAADKLQFNRDIRPILSDTCFHCHGPDEKERQAGLRLDVRQQALMPAESGLPAIVPGQVESSQLLARVFSDDPELVMPPPQLHKPLTSQQR
ncbi:MAG: c-type cytochrome domain-containing protein, partial [bacterium]